MTDTSREAPIKARRIHFDFSRSPLQWIPGAPYASHVINVLHLIAPVGERRFIRAASEALPYLADGRLREQVKGFIAQEASHAHVHQAVLDHMRAQGLDTQPYLDAYEELYDFIAGDRPFLPMPAAWWLNWKLAFTAAAEQITCVLGDWSLRADALDAAGADPVMLNFLRWHGAEEVEHRAVAFDVLKRLAGPGEYPVRVLAMLTLFPVLVGLWSRGTAYFIDRDPDLAGRQFSMLDFAQAAERGLLPGWELLSAAFRFLDPNFDPRHEATPANAAAFFATAATAYPAPA
jgi:predicted metal-dependent hydrolase